MVLSLQATKKEKVGLICSLHIAGASRLSLPLRDWGSRPVGSISYMSSNPPESGIKEMSQLSILWVVFMFNTLIILWLFQFQIQFLSLKSLVVGLVGA